MKPSKIILLLTILLISAALSACAGGAGTATSWPGLTVDQDTAYLAYNQHVFAIDVETGVEIWRFPAEADNKITFFAPPALTPDGQLLAGGYNNVLYSLDPVTGRENWNFSGAKNRYVGSPLAAEQGIFAPNADDNLYALDTSGKLRWSYKTRGPQWAAPAQDPGCECVYLPSMDHHLYSLDAQSGSLNWQTEELGGSLVGTPAYSESDGAPGGVLYVGTFDSKMLAVEAGSGKVIWSAPTSGWVWSGPALKDGTLYFGDLKGTVYAMSAADGAILWQQTPDGPVTQSPLVTDDSVYFTTEAGTVYAYDLEGNSRWNQTIGGKLYASPVTAKDLILAAPVGTDSPLVALDLEGAQKWAFTPEK
jgi:outer membrane protein assembly factor BamB